MRSEKCKATARAYYRRNIERINQVASAHYALNAASVDAYQLAWRQDNAAHLKKYFADYRAKKKLEATL